MGKGTYSPKKVAKRELRGQALELRKAGATYEKIGATLGVNPTTARNYVVKSLQNMEAEGVDELRRIHYERLNHMLVVLWPRVQKGELPAMDRAVGIMDRIAKLYGVDAATLHTESREVIVIDGSKDDYIDNLKAIKQMAVSRKALANGDGPDSDEPHNTSGEEIIDATIIHTEEE